MLSRLTSRHLLLALFLTCTAMMAFGYYLQYAVGLEPCPLCITQRVFIVAVGLTALIGALHGPRSTLGVRVYAVIALVFALVGGAFAGRHVWLQMLPEDQKEACGPGIEYLLENFPPMQALEVLLRGNGNCSVVDWTFLGLSIPMWTLVAFIGFALLLFWASCAPRPRPAR